MKKSRLVAVRAYLADRTQVTQEDIQTWLIIDQGVMSRVVAKDLVSALLLTRDLKRTKHSHIFEVAGKKKTLVEKIFFSKTKQNKKGGAKHGVQKLRK